MYNCLYTLYYINANFVILIKENPKKYFVVSGVHFETDHAVNFSQQNDFYDLTFAKIMAYFVIITNR